jgi:hypothetical protein
VRKFGDAQNIFTADLQFTYPFLCPEFSLPRAKLNTRFTAD